MEHSSGNAAARPYSDGQQDGLKDLAWRHLHWSRRSAKEGAAVVLPLLAAGTAAIRLFPPAAPVAFAAAAVAALAFRDPERAVIPQPDVALAPADGSILHVTRVWDAHWEAEMMEVAIFLALWDVHVQRSPFDGEIVAQHRRAGGYRPAMTRAATHGNNQLATHLSTPVGPCTVTQISGMLARRIVSWAKAGDRLTQGERLGIIKFGSQVTLRVPSTFTSLVTSGDRVRAGLTPLARL